MTTEALPAPVPEGARDSRHRLGIDRIDKRYLAPILVTLVLIMGQLTFGFLESWSRTFLAIGTE